MSATPSPLPSSSSTCTKKVSSWLEPDKLKTPGLELRTAKQVRADTARAHGHDLGVDSSMRSLTLGSAGSLDTPVSYANRLRE